MSDNAPRVLLRSEESDGRVAIVELSGGGRPPLHTHDFDEAFYVLEGELTFQLGSERFTCRAGELAFAGRGVPHTYANLSPDPPIGRFGGLKSGVGVWVACAMR